MYYLIESKNQIEYLIDHASDECYINLITLNDNFHPKLTSPSLFYYKPLNDKAYMLCLNHSDGFQLECKDILNLLSKHSIIHTLDKKFHLYFLSPGNSLVDVQFNKLQKDNDIFDFKDCSTTAHDIFYSKHSTHPELNKLIPISKHFEKQEKMFSKVSQYLSKGVFKNYENKRLSETFWRVEKEGIRINVDKFYKHFEPGEGVFSVKDDRVYTRFNLYNLTTRPTNTFNGINFSALTKQSRVAFIPDNDIFVEFDYDGYHLRLADFHHELSAEPAHEQLAKLYFNTPSPTEDQIKSAKLLTFKQLYGGIEDQYLHIPYFKFIAEEVNRIWEEFEESDFQILFGTRTLHNKGDLNKNKLFNYMIQSKETFLNVHTLNDVFPLMEGKKTKLVHYTYDSFLFDVSVNDGKELIENIEKALSINYPVKKTYGKNYKEMCRF